MGRREGERHGCLPMMDDLRFARGVSAGDERPGELVPVIEINDPRHAGLYAQADGMPVGVGEALSGAAPLAIRDFL